MKRVWGVKKLFSFLALTVFVLLTACGGGGDGGGGGGGGGNSSGGGVYIDAFQFSGTTNYCCWTSSAYTWFTSNFKNSDGSGNEPSYARNAPDGNYAIMQSTGFSLMTGTNATSQSGIKVYIASGSSGTYSVYGGNTIPTSLCSYGTPYCTCSLINLGYNPQNYGFTYLGESNTTQEFLGNYLYYIVKTGGGGGTTLNSIAVTPANSSITTGNTQQFTATGSYSDSTTQDITSSVSWNSSNTSVSTISSGGLATAVAVGSTTITATLGNISGNTLLTVTSGGGGGSAPSAPTGVSATAGDGQTTISWNAVSGATSYNIYWATTSGVTKTTGTKISSVTSPYTHTGLTNGTTYYYVVTGINACGDESGESNQLSATPQEGSWTATSTTNAPSARDYHTAVWTGTEMIVWGGWNGSNSFNTGGSYNPTTDSWTATSTINVPSARVVHTAVWTGTQMIIWGGDSSGSFNTGGRYTP
ncbi:MAG: Ig-like domain-containing protein [Nitrospirae bacterium]|nr:Ig-like domain-containing protein [Nitrospirota bacterium]